MKAALFHACLAGSFQEGLCTISGRIAKTVWFLCCALCVNLIAVASPHSTVEVHV